jgi:hypothetical protein
MINHVKQWHSTTHQPQMSPLSLVWQRQIQPLDHFGLSLLPSHPLALRDFRASKHQLYPVQSLPWRYRMQRSRGVETSAGFFSRIGKYKNLVKNAWAWDIIALHWQSEESVKGYWLADSQLWILKWSESEEWSMLLLPSFTWGFLSSYVLVALGFLRFFSRLAFSDDTTTLNNGLPNQQNGQQNAAPDAVEIPINLNLPATCSAVCFFRILAWNCPFLSADVTSEGRCYMSSQRRPLFAPVCSSTFSHLGIGSATKTHSLSVLQPSSWRRGWLIPWQGAQKNPIWSLAAKHIKTSKHNKRKNVKEWDWTASFYHPQSQGQLQVQKRNQKPPNRTSNARTHYQKFSWAPANRPIE